MRAAVTIGLLGVAVLTPVSWSMAAQVPGGDPSYVVRGRQAEVRQRALRERVERFHQTLSAALKAWAPDVLKTLEPPPPGVFGYQLLPRIVADAPPTPPAKPQVVSYSWRWSETLIDQQMATLDRLEADLAKTPPAAASRTTYEALTADYKKVIDHRRLIDADFDYNWLWQAAIARDRPLFDRMTALLESARDRQSRNEPLTADVVAAMSRANPPAYMRIDRPAEHQWVVTVPLYTDIPDADFVERVRTSIEEHWHVRDGEDEFRVRLVVTAISPERLYCASADAASQLTAGCAPPAKGAHLDLVAHAARFPKDGVVLTTGAASLRLIAGFVLSPHDVTPASLAHEFGHLLGFPDAYFRGYRDLGADGFQVMELVPDSDDIMSASRSGAVLARHFENLIAARDAASPRPAPERPADKP